MSPTSPHTDTTLEDDLLSARRLSVVPKVQPYSVEYLKLMGEISFFFLPFSLSFFHLIYRSLRVLGIEYY